MAVNNWTITNNPFTHFFHVVTGVHRDAEQTNRFLRVWSRRLGGIWLMVLYVAIFYVVIMSLTAYQIQNRIHQVRSGDLNVSVWQITRLAELRKQADSRKLDLELDISDLEDKAKDLDNELEEIERDLTDTITETNGKARTLGHFDMFNLELGEFQKRLQAIAGHDDANGDVLNSYIEKLEKLVDRKDTTNRKLDRIYAKIRRHTETIRKNSFNSLLEKQQAKNGDEQGDDGQSLARITDLIDEIQFFSCTRDYEGLFSLCNTLNYIFGNNKSGASNTYLFITIPSSVLVMMIVVAMGMMGSMINITQAFFSGEERRITFYIFRPFLGAVVAIAVYVVTKAGVLVSSNPTAQVEEVAKLNAFFVSFLALISGLMSEAAIDMLKRSGTRFLRGNGAPGQMRYARNIEEIIGEKKRDKTMLYPSFDVSKQLVDKWLDASEKVPIYAQRIIAAWLEEPIREIFSDIPPKKAEDPQSLEDTGSETTDGGAPGKNSDSSESGSS